MDFLDGMFYTFHGIINTVGSDTMIRYATIKDADAIYELICELEETAFDKDIFFMHYKRNLKDDKFIYMVDENSGVIAFGSIYFHYPLHHCAKIAEIEELCVKQTHQHQGIGSKMFTALCTCAKEKGALQVELSCNKTRQIAHAFYKKQGMMQQHDKFTYPLGKEQK